MLTRLATNSLRHAVRFSTLRTYSSVVARQRSKAWTPFVWGSAFTIAASLAFSIPTVYADAKLAWQKEESDYGSMEDPVTTISFPKTIRMSPDQKFTLVGLGVRSLTVFGFKVYSIGFYADLESPSLRVSPDMTPQQKIDHIIRNTGCVIRIVPTRTTNMKHLREAFTRALNKRLAKAKESGELTEEQAYKEGFPIRQLEGLFPNSPLAKNTPFNIVVPDPKRISPRAMALDDLGVVQSDWVATNLLLHYFGHERPSPALIKSALENIADFEK